METCEGRAPMCSYILSTDMSKAFDSLHPRLMLNKLRAYGFEKSTVNLLLESEWDHRVALGKW